MKQQKENNEMTNTINRETIVWSAEGAEVIYAHDNDNFELWLDGDYKGEFDKSADAVKAAQVAKSAKDNKMNTKNDDKNGFMLCAESGSQGFRMTFANGWSISVQWSNFNYCANKSYSLNFDAAQEPHCTTAECAVWDADGTWFPLSEHDDVIGWQTPDEVAALITRVAAFPVGSDMLDEADTILE